MGGFEIDGPEMPKDLGTQGRKEWRRLMPLLMDAGTLAELDGSALANVCRIHEMVLEIQAEIKRARKAGTFSVLATTKTGYQTKHPLLVALDQQIGSYNRALAVLGMTTASRSRMEIQPGTKARRPPGLTGPEPRHGWSIEEKLCDVREPCADEIESERRRAANQKLLAEGDWRKYEENFDGGKKHG